MSDGYSGAVSPPAASGPRIAVLGGGIGGLAAAAFMRRVGLTATVYEQAPQLREVGAGINVPPNAARLLRMLGRLDVFEEQAVALEAAWEFRRWRDGHVISSESLVGRCRELYGEQLYVTHRADLLEVIRGAVPPSWVRLGKRCVRVDQGDDDVRLTFADTSSVVADVVVGADGVHSLVREAVTSAPEPQPSGLGAYRALVPVHQAPAFARRPVMNLWLGPERHVVHYPVCAGRMVNIVAIGPVGATTDDSWTSTAPTAEMLAEFDGWAPSLLDLLGAAEAPGRWALLERPPLPRWSSGRLTLVGDAAHPMFPTLAQGAAQAIEDGAALARHLAERPQDPVAALQHYEDGRRPRADEVQRLSRERMESNHLPDGVSQRRRDHVLAQGGLLQTNAWLYRHDADAAAREDR